MEKAHAKRGIFYCGTSNVELPVPNKSYFPAEFQDRSRLCYYASLFNTVEVNSSFYKVPQGKTVAKWASEVPGLFRFTYKLWKGITHVPLLQYDQQELNKFLDVINNAGDKKGCLLIQFPASVKASLFSNFKKLLTYIQTTGKVDGWALAIEFRDSSWYTDTVYELLDQYNATLVVHDMPKSRTPQVELLSDTVYLRFHGEKGDYRGTYEEDVLRDYAYLVKDWLQEGKTVYAYFNNTAGGGAVGNAATLYRYVSEMV